MADPLPQMFLEAAAELIGKPLARMASDHPEKMELIVLSPTKFRVRFDGSPVGVAYVDYTVTQANR